jgi:hypothetical protein
MKGGEIMQLNDDDFGKIVHYLNQAIEQEKHLITVAKNQIENVISNKTEVSENDKDYIINVYKSDISNYLQTIIEIDELKKKIMFSSD